MDLSEKTHSPKDPVCWCRTQSPPAKSKVTKSSFARALGDLVQDLFERAGAVFGRASRIASQAARKQARRQRCEKKTRQQRIALGQDYCETMGFRVIFPFSGPFSDHLSQGKTTGSPDFLVRGGTGAPPSSCVQEPQIVPLTQHFAS